jgi:RHS repeat-associated protein
VSRSSSAPSAPTGTVHYLYDLDGHLIAEADGATGVVLRDYIWLPSNLQPSGLTRGDNDNAAPGGAFSDHLVIAGASNDNAPPDLPLAVIDGVNTASPSTYQVHSDHLGRPVAMTDAAKASVWSAVWTPWGEAHALTGSAINNLRFPGQYFFIETNHAYNWHRTYDPVSGRYTQPDPLGFVDGPSIYAYAGNSPFMKTDREGLVSYPHSPKPTVPPNINIPGGGTKNIQLCIDAPSDLLDSMAAYKMRGGNRCWALRDLRGRGIWSNDELRRAEKYYGCRGSSLSR